MAQSIKCVIFDCDGTLIDSERLCCQALVNVFARFNIALSLEEALSQHEGGKLADVLSTACEHLGVTISLDTLEPLYRTELKILFEKDLRPMKGAKDLLDYLSNTGIEYCVVSNGPLEKIQYSLDLTRLLPYFKGKMFSAFDANSWKPDPDLICYAAMNMGYSLSECIYVDDTPKGIEAGVSAGVKTFLLGNAHNQNPQVETFSELPSIKTWLN
ncbi:HAD-IA family hydrolase [Vibrio genomosp. F10]|uniref:HAD family hydrolase n=2 Tax=Vibrio genomosp. F10 TaxID=723171 RepID=A0A1B9QYC7_9VIBR|nr:HAD-IA family hydrolase [Vibrio genomosp. F10]OCH75628.1 HAD family hydrolase [Vibrio genomosp. F10]OEE31312.1 HAD family hydrolase [Vibrio genomosp. F10 str. ZF-129]OEE96521.1 HAD family hydrolase [Vibrio genomosp. F10 str. 9ZC157]OEF06730.1 HAD family hydrolase [Vibrio genomosp. F10 str. 9ZD137]OEF10639.1 HAD family hydrolase [Vibrio genomosp. F10 str. 9ZB36]